MLEAWKKPEAWKSVVLPPDRIRPLPVQSDRRAWEAADSAGRSYWMEQANRYLSYEWPSLLATAYMNHDRTGDRTTYSSLYWPRRNAIASLVIGECLENQGRFLDQIVNGVWLLCEETTWVKPEHKDMSSRSREFALYDWQDQAIDLFAAKTAALLAWTYVLLQDRLETEHPLVCQRIREEVERRIVLPYVRRTDFRWMGFDPDVRLNNWNPWIHVNVLTVFLLLVENEELRLYGLAKIAECLDFYAHSQEVDGGSDEGPYYWNRSAASLYECAELLHIGTAGRINLFGDPLLQEKGKYIYRVYIGGDCFYNYSDCDARLNLCGDLLYRYGMRIGDAKLSALGSRFRKPDEWGGNPLWISLYRAIPALLHEHTLLEPSLETPFIHNMRLPQTDVFAAREQPATCKGFYVAAKGGHNAQSHNHNDLGSGIVYMDGLPILVDPGVETYSRQTFSQDRHHMWTMRSAYHNVPIIGGCEQRPGGSYCAIDSACSFTDSLAEWSTELANAYPPEAGIRSWRRTWRLLRSRSAYVEVEDTFELKEETTDITIPWMTPCSIRLSPGEAVLTDPSSGVAVRLNYDTRIFTGVIDDLELNDRRIRAMWSKGLRRIRLVLSQPIRKASWQFRLERL